MVENKIKNIYIHMTRKCNLKCSYCYFNAGDNSDADHTVNTELSFEEFNGLFKDIAALSPEKLVFTGGEPLLRDDIYPIAAAFRSIDASRRTRLCLMSNGTLIDENQAFQIAKHFDEIRISVDGLPYTNDRLRGEGVFSKAERAIRLLNLAGISPGISVTLTSENSGKLEAFMEYAVDNMHVNQFHFSPFRPVGRGFNRNDLLCSWTYAQSVIFRFWEKRYGFIHVKKDAESYMLKTCGSCGIGCYINILQDGSVYPCHVLSTPEFLIGNIRQQSLSDILNAESVLKKLESLDLKEIYKKYPQIESLYTDAVCLGELLINSCESLKKLL
ncbi:MAG: radical SAM protein [Bacillota bacterium]|nr:radical SAM protein [Bacillota bacterium]